MPPHSQAEEAGYTDEPDPDVVEPDEVQDPTEEEAEEAEAVVPPAEPDKTNGD